MNNKLIIGDGSVKSCVITRMTIEQYTAFNKYCKFHDYRYCIIQKAGQYIDVSCQKRILDNFTSRES